MTILFNKGQLLYTNMIIMIMLLSLVSCKDQSTPSIQLKKDSHISIIGGNMCSRMTHFGHFEAEIQQRYSDSQLIIRNMCDGGDTPGFRPRSSRSHQWAFPGAEKYQDEYARDSKGVGDFPSPDEWLSMNKTDVILAFFGYTSSYAGTAGINNFKNELQGFIDHTNSQIYNDSSSPQLVLISPTAFEDLSATTEYPQGQKQNKNIKLYRDLIEEVAQKNSILFIDAYTLSEKLQSKEQITTDGYQLSDRGYELLSPLIVDELVDINHESNYNFKDIVIEAVKEKNWMWHNDYKIPNGVHVYGRRHEPFGPDNYPEEIKKLRELTSIRDKAIHSALTGKKTNLKEEDHNTTILTKIETNYTLSKGNEEARYLYGEDALASIHTAPGYKVELFASEQEFPDLANPAQLSFDNKGRLWVATLPSYPHYKPGDSKPDDKLLILEDTNHDGKADKQIIYADGLHLPIGFEFAPEGVYVSQGTNLKLYKDTDGDDHADEVDIVFSGFDDHDTHHAISAFCADPSGAIYMAEGWFLHSSIETSYGTQRSTYGGFYRMEPVRRHLQRIAQLDIPNPWGIAFDQWGQAIYAQTSNPEVHWMLPGTVLPLYGDYTPTTKSLIEEEYKVRPTSGLEFVYSRHFPEKDQGDFLICNSIGFLGMKQHTLEDDGTGYKSQFKKDIFYSTDKNFRPVDMEFAPDGSLYVVDWHNVLIGHMQHNARDPLRDHVHGRIYRITYPSRPLVRPADVEEAAIEALLDNLKLPEYRTRYRSRRALRSRDRSKILIAINKWLENLDPSDSAYERYKLEALWVTWGINRVDKKLLTELLDADDYKIRTAAVEVLRHTGHQVDNQTDLLLKAANDDHGRVRLAAIVAASRLEKSDAYSVLDIANQHPLDEWMQPAYNTAIAHINGEPLVKEEEKAVRSHLVGNNYDIYVAGKEIYEREGYCITCHQQDGKGLSASEFPPLAGSKWVTQNDERLIKLTLKGLHGPIKVQDKTYPGQVPMTPYEGLLNDNEMSQVLTYVRNSWGNKSSVVYGGRITEIRSKIKDKKGFYSPDELLAEHPHRDSK